MECCTISCDIESPEKIKKRPAGEKSRLRAFCRLAGYFGITLIHVLRAEVHNLIYASSDNKNGRSDSRTLQRWARDLNRAMGLMVTMNGTLPMQVSFW